MREITKGILLKNFLILGTLAIVLYLIFAASANAQQSDPHGTSNVNTKYCESCHDIHEPPPPRLQSQEKVSLLKNEDEKAVCYTCHNGTAVPPEFDVQKEFGDNLDGSSSKTSYHPVHDGTLVCSDCHTSHGEMEDWQPPEGLTEVIRLLRVKMDDFWGFLVNRLNLVWLETPSRQRIQNPDQYCGGCHGPGSTLPGGDLVTNYLGSAHETKLSEPEPPLSPIKCNVCHLWHGSDLPALLQPQVNGVNLTGNDNTLCYICHSTASGAFGGQTIFEQTKHSTETSSSKASPVWPGKSYQAGICVNCHNSHGTVSTDMRRADQNNLCTECHDTSGVTLPSGYFYQGKERYGFSAHGEDITSFNVWPDPTETGFAVGTGGSQPGECINCHNPMGKDNGISVPFPKLLLRWELKQGGSPPLNDSGEENLCYGGSAVSGACHTVPYTYVDTFYGTGIRSSNIFELFNPLLPLTATAPSGAKINQRHDISLDDQVNYNPAAKVECDSCHNPHLNNKGFDFTSASKVANPDNLGENWISQYKSDNVFSFSGNSFSFSPTDLDPTFGSALPDFVNFCLSCHDDNLPPGVNFGAVPPIFIALYYSAVPGGSPPAIVDDHGRGDGHGGTEGTLKFPYFGTFLGDTGEPADAYAAMNCTDCHDSHGSGGLYSLRTNITIDGVSLQAAGGSTTFTVTDNNFGGGQGWCSFCHEINAGHEATFGSDCGSCHFHGSNIF